MDGLFWLNVVSRWLHVGSAVVAVGGLLFLAWVLLPAARSAGAGSEPALEATYRQFKPLFHGAIGLLLLTGVYNFMVVLPRVEGLAALKPVYHGVIGIKILLALAVIGLGSAWLGRALRGEMAILQRDRLLVATVVLALLVLLLSAILRRVWDRHPGMQGATMSRHAWGMIDV